MLTRQELKDLLKKWESGELSTAELHEEAEHLMNEYGEEGPFSKSDPRSIEHEILTQLDMLDHQLITREDIPAMLEFLSTSSGDEDCGWERWIEYSKSIDYLDRARQLLDHAYYGSSALLEAHENGWIDLNDEFRK